MHSNAANVHWPTTGSPKMNIFESIFPALRRLPRIDKAPPGARWRNVRPRETAKSVSARLADSDGDIKSERGVLHYARDRDFLVEHAPGDIAVVDRATFEQTYRMRDDGRFQKRTDITYRYFQLPHAAIVQTDEGPQRAEPNDWIMEGLHGEIWPVHEAKARKIYEMV
jgi:hypothetical protein